jgi:hypothetical protein
MMSWQRSVLATPLLNLARPLHKDAVRTFRAIQRLMGDNEKGAATAPNRLEEARWLLGEGLSYGELRDEVYCQVMKQLTSNPNACVLCCIQFLLSMLTYLLTLQGEYFPRVATAVCVASHLPALEEFRAIPSCLPLAAHGNYRGSYRRAR